MGGNAKLSSHGRKTVVMGASLCIIELLNGPVNKKEWKICHTVKRFPTTDHRLPNSCPISDV